MNYDGTKKVLNQLVADLSQFATIIHQTHWYMRGTDFLTLHPLMDDYMDDINDQLDEVAERLITLGGKPYSTLREFAEHTNLDDEIGSYDKSMSERLARLVDGFRYLQALYQKGIDISGDEGDDVSQDIFIGAKADAEKKLWMLQAELGKEPEVTNQNIDINL